MSVALDFMYQQQYRNEEMEESIKSLGLEVIEFCIKKIKKENRYGDEVFQDVVKRLRSIKFVIGFPNIDSDKLEDLYGDLKFGDEFNYAEITDRIEINHYKVNREPAASKTRKLIELLPQGYKNSFNYFPEEDILSKKTFHFIAP